VPYYQPELWLFSELHKEDQSHPPYSPNVVPSNFNFFGPLEDLDSKQNATDTNTKQAVTSWLQTFGSEFF